MGSSRSITIAFPDATDLSKFDPANIHMASEWECLMLLYSPLVEITSTGEIVAGAAESFRWDGSRLILRIRPDLRTADGQEITAEDAATSLKRLLVLDTNYHGNLRNFLDADDVRDAFAPAESIQVIGNELVLRTKGKTKFLLTLLSSADFVVIPIGSIDRETLAIKDYRNTSGPYHFARRDSQGRIVLSRNAGHWRHEGSLKTPTEVVLFPDQGTSSGRPLSFEPLKNGEIDLIPHANSWGRDTLLALEKDVPGSTIHVTENIFVSLLYFTPKGLRLPAAKRRALARRIQSWVTKNNTSPFRTSVDQFLPPQSQGGLSTEQLEEMRQLFAKTPSEELPKDIVIATPKELRSLGEELFRNDVIKVRLVDWESRFFDFAQPSYEGSEYPDLIWIGQDIAYDEDYSLLAYSISTGKFTLKGRQGQEWLKRFAYEEDAAKRTQMVKDLHFLSVAKDPSIIPLFAAPYVALSQNGWQMDFSKISATSPIWKVTKSE